MKLNKMISVKIIIGGSINDSFFIKGIGYIPPENAHLDYVDNDTDEPKSTP